MCFTSRMKSFPPFWYGQSKSIIILAISVEAWQTIKILWFILYFPLYQSHCQLVWNFRNATRNSFGIWNEVFSLNLDMANPNPSSILGNVQWMLSTIWKTVIYIVFSIMQLSLPTCLIFRNASSIVFGIPNKLFLLNIGLANPNPSLFLGNVQWRLAKQTKESEIPSVFYNSTITANCFKF